MSYIGSTPTTQSFIAGTDYFNGTGSAVNFTLSRSVNSVNDIEVIVNNVEQIPSGYSVSGTTLTFSAAPSAGTSNVYVRYLSTTNLSLAIPSGTSATFNTVNATSLTAGNLAYTGTLTGNGGIINIGSGQVYKDASGNVGVGTSSPSQRLTVAGAGTAARLEVINTSDLNRGGYLRDTGSTFELGTNSGVRPLAFAYDGSEKMRINSSGNLLINWTGSATYKLFASADSAGSDYPAAFNNANTGSSNQIVVDILRNNTRTGYITNTNTTTAFTSTSDYRLKEDVAPMTGALEKVAALKPVTYKWKVDGSDGQGFIAHELAEVVPDCVSGEKDAVETYTDEDGNEATRPAYQGIDTSFLVATLTAAIQEQQAIITALTTRITALEAK